MDESIKDYLENQFKNIATKDDLKDFATKDDLKAFATKDDLKDFATKDDLKAFATKDDLKDFATKDDLASAVAELGRVINETIAEPMEKHFAEHKRDLDVSKDVEALKLDMKKIKDALAMNGNQPVKVS
jgi:hypothetical protein